MHYFKSVLATGLLSLLIIGCKKETPLTKTNLQSAEQNITISRNIPGKVNGKGTDKPKPNDLKKRLNHIKTDFKHQDFKKYSYKGQQGAPRDCKNRTRVNIKTGQNEIMVTVLVDDAGQYNYTVTRFPAKIPTAHTATLNGVSSVYTVKLSIVSVMVTRKDGRTKLSSQDKLDMMDYYHSKLNYPDFTDPELEDTFTMNTETSSTSTIKG